MRKQQPDVTMRSTGTSSGSAGTVDDRGAAAVRTVVKATGVLAVFQILSKVLGFVRDLVIAGRFGATGLTDGYNAVFFGLSAAISSALGIAVSTGFLPIFSEFRTSGREREGWGVARLVLLFSGAASVVISVLAAIFARPLLALLFNLEPAAYEAAVVMARIILPATAFSSLFAIIQVTLNAYGRFGTPALAMSVMNVLTIFGATLLSRWFGIAGLAWGTFIGMLSQVLILIRPLASVGGWRRLLHDRISGTAGVVDGARRVWMLALPPFLSQIVSQGYQLIDKGLASTLAPGTVSALGYASRVIQVPVGVIASSVGTASFPTLAALASRGDNRNFARSLSSALRTAALLLIPASVGMIAFREPFIRVLFQRGAFTKTATDLTAGALAFYSVSIIGQSFAMILSPAFSARKNTLATFKVIAVGSVINILSDFFFVRYIGHLGLALASAIAATFQAAVLYIWMRHDVPEFRGWGLGKAMAKMVFAALAMVPPALWVFGRVARLVGTGTLGELICLGCAAVVGGVVYFLLLAVLRVGAGEGVNMVRSRLRRR